jgi:DMSO reductase anchor subunit
MADIQCKEMKEPEMQPGYTTTEFYVTLLAQIQSYVAIIHPGFHFNNSWVQSVSLIASTAMTGAYLVSRTVLKKNHQTVTSQTAPTLYDKSAVNSTDSATTSGSTTTGA